MFRKTEHDIICKGCKKPLNSLRKHFSRNKDCESAYSKEELSAFADASEEMKKTGHSRKNETVQER